MYSTSGVIFIFVIALIIGTGLGVLLSRVFKSISGNTETLKEKLAKTEEQLADYQVQVTEHFLETSRRVNTLTKNYKEVHEYLASSAAKLANPNMNKDGFAAQITLSNDNTYDTDKEDEKAEVIEQEALDVSLSESETNDKIDREQQEKPKRSTTNEYS